MRILLIDDLRKREDPVIARYVWENDDLVIARNFADGIRALRDHRWDLLLLDHDFADFGGTDADIYVQYYMGQKEWTGYEVLRFLEINLEEHPGYIPDDIGMVTDNAGKCKTMEQTVESIYRRLIAMEKQAKGL